MLTKEEIIREEVIETAQKLFQKFGFSKTTMEDIAKAMDAIINLAKLFITSVQLVALIEYKVV